MQRNKRAGFTLVELLIVIVVIAILAAITIVAYGGISARAHASAIQADLKQDSQALEAYKVSAGSYPNSLTDANIHTPTSGTPSYYPNGTSGYCLQIVNGSTSYSLTSDNQSPTSGDCTQAGLVGWWKFDGDTSDSTTNGNDGSITGGVTLTTGQDGKANDAYAFDGTSGYIVIPTSTVFNSPNITFSAWIKVTSTTPSLQEIISKETQYKYRLTGADIGVLESATGSSWNNQNTFATTTLAAGTWYNVVMTIDSLNSLISVYVNGAADGSSATMTTPITTYNTKQVNIGSYNNSGGELFGGSIDDVRIYNRALTPSEVQALYASGAQ